MAPPIYAVIMAVRRRRALEPQQRLDEVVADLVEVVRAGRVVAAVRRGLSESTAAPTYGRGPTRSSAGGRRRAAARAPVALRDVAVPRDRDRGDAAALEARGTCFGLAL